MCKFYIYKYKYVGFTLGMLGFNIRDKKNFFSLLKGIDKTLQERLSVVLHTYNLCTWEAEVGRLLKV